MREYIVSFISSIPSKSHSLFKHLLSLCTSYYNVIQARRKANKPVLEPLLGLLPYFFHTVLLVAWLAGPKVDIVPTEKILWFTVYWAAT
jgi:ethanolaminephosphotransferase